MSRKGPAASRRHGWSGALAGNGSHNALGNGPLTHMSVSGGQCGLGGVWTEAMIHPKHRGGEWGWNPLSPFTSNERGWGWKR